MKSNGAMVGLIIIILILVIGGIYMWWANKNKADSTQVPQYQAVSPSDSNDLNTLEADVKGADTSTGVDVNSVQ